VAEPSAEPPPEAVEMPAVGSVIGFVHLQFCVSEGPPLLAVLNMQVVKPAMGKGLGKFALTLLELMARQHGMELVMLHMKDGKVATLKLNRPTPRSPTQRPTPTAGSATPPMDQPNTPRGVGGGDCVADDGFEMILKPQCIMPRDGGLVPVSC